jgi:dTDP-4-dehydrorhamnose reductase
MMNPSLAPNLYNGAHDQLPGCVVVTGLAGVPGWALFRHLHTIYPTQVFGVAPEHNTHCNHDGVWYCNAENVLTLRSQIQALPAPLYAIVDASGNCALRACECAPEQSALLNCKQGLDFAQLASEFGAQYIRISSDLVFSGARPQGSAPYVETDPIDPVTKYGLHLSMSEQAALELYSKTRILRIGLPMEYSPNGVAGAVDWIGWRFSKNRPATLYFDELRSNLFAYDLCQIVLLALQYPDFLEPGIYHCGGPRPLSLYQIGQIINVCGNFDPNCLLGCMRIEAGPMPPRAGDVTMNSSKLLQALQKLATKHRAEPFALRAWPADPLLLPNNKNWHFEFDRSILGGRDLLQALLVDGKMISDC